MYTNCSRHIHTCVSLLTGRSGSDASTFQFTHVPPSPARLLLGATAMSVAARRLSACVPQELLGRRASPTVQDLASQMCHLDSAFLSPYAEGNHSSVHREAPALPQVKTQGQDSASSCRHVPYSASCTATHTQDTPLTSESVGSPFTFLALNAARRLSSGSGKEQQDRLPSDHLAGRRRSFDVTMLSAQALSADKRRSSLRYGHTGVCSLAFLGFTNAPKPSQALL